MTLVGIKDDIVVGAAMGTAAHGLGTAKAISVSQLQGSVSGFSMGLAGIITSILIVPILWFVNLI